MAGAGPAPRHLHRGRQGGDGQQHDPGRHLYQERRSEQSRRQVRQQTEFFVRIFVFFCFILYF